MQYLFCFNHVYGLGFSYNSQKQIYYWPSNFSFGKEKSRFSNLELMLSLNSKLNKKPYLSTRI